MLNDGKFTVVNRFQEDNIWYKSSKVMYGKIAEWYEKGYIPADTISLQANKGYVRWKGALADDTVCISQLDITGSIQESAVNFSKLTESDVVVFKGRQVWYTELGNATGMSIPYTSTCPERAMMLINEMYINPELYQLWVYGIKDVHYVENEDGTITTLGGDGQATSDWAYGQWRWTFGNCMLARQTQTDASDPVAQLQKDLSRLKNAAFVRPFLSWSLDKTNIQSEYSNMKVIMDEFNQQMKSGIHGANWEAVFDSYMAEIQDAGIDKIVAEVQRQVTEYATANGITSTGDEQMLTLEKEQTYAIVRYADVAN